MKNMRYIVLGVECDVHNPKDLIEFADIHKEIESTMNKFGLNMYTMQVKDTMIQDEEAEKFKKDSLTLKAIELAIEKYGRISIQYYCDDSGNNKELVMEYYGHMNGATCIGVLEWYDQIQKEGD